MINSSEKLAALLGALVIAGLCGVGGVFATERLVRFLTHLSSLHPGLIHVFAFGFPLAIAPLAWFAAKRRRTASTRGDGYPPAQV